MKLILCKGNGVLLCMTTVSCIENGVLLYMTAVSCIENGVLLYMISAIFKFCMVYEQIRKFSIDVIVRLPHLDLFKQSKVNNSLQISSRRHPCHAQGLGRMVNLGVGMEKEVVEQFMPIALTKFRAQDRLVLRHQPIDAIDNRNRVRGRHLNALQQKSQGQAPQSG